MAQSINVIGCGNAAKPLLRLWHEGGTFEVLDVSNRSIESAHAAVRFIGSGRAVASPSEMRPADVLLFGAPDDALYATADAASRSNALAFRGTAFHLSGARSSSVLEPLRALRSAVIASAHPLRSFADSESAAAGFAGTFLALEGDEAAKEVLKPAFEQIGGKVFEISALGKLDYHTAAVMLSNYVVALAELGLRAFERAGLGRADGLQLAASIMRGTLDNLAALGPIDALTGPIERGDIETVRRQIEALAHRDSEAGELYRKLGNVCLGLALKKHGKSMPKRSDLEKLLRR